MNMLHGDVGRRLYRNGGVRTCFTVMWGGGFTGMEVYEKITL